MDTALADIEAKLSALDIAKAQLDQVKAPPREVDLASQQATVSRLNAVVEDAQNQLEKAMMVAPIAGTITAIHYEVGEQVPTGSPFLNMLTSLQYEVEVDISEAVIAKIKLGDPVEMTFDAFGAQNYSSAMCFIDPAETIISDVVYYTVKIQVAGTDRPIKPGMTANVDIRTATRNNVLFIPQRAVVSVGKINTVSVLKSKNVVEERMVELGLRADIGLVEILSGLEQGEDVVTFVKEEK